MGMFDQPEKKTKLIIVHSQNTAVFANFLQMMITSNDDEGETVVGIKDGSVETTIWSDKEYVAQKPTLSSNDHILFIGRGKIIPEECYGMQSKYDNYGMTYGWLGKRAYLKINDTPTKFDEIKSFLDYAKKYDPQVTFDEIIGAKAAASAAKRKGIGGFLKNVGKYMLPLGPLWFMDAELKDRVKSIQYRCLTIVFYKEGLDKFLQM